MSCPVTFLWANQQVRYIPELGQTLSKFFLFQNDKALVKLLLNNSYEEEKGGKTDSHRGLKRQMSRQVFAIKPASHTPEPVPESQDEGKDEDNKDDEEEEEDEENEEDNQEEEGTYCFSIWLKHFFYS